MFYRAPVSSLTTRALATDYLALCHNPLNDLSRWAFESGKAYQGRSPSNKSRSADAAQSPSPCLDSRPNRLRDDTLHEVRRGLDPFRGRRLGYRVSSRPGAGLSQYDQLRSFRAQGQETPSEARSVPQSEASANAVAPSSSLATDLAAAKGYYASRIAAARQSLSHVELAAAIRTIKDEETLASRAIIQRWEGYFQNKEQIPEKGPERPTDPRPVLRYPGFRKS